MKISSLQAFVVLSELGRFHAAANFLHISQPTLSRRIAKLEDYLGVKLLDRSKKITKLTPIGVEFLESAREMVKLADSSLRRVREVSDIGGRPITIGVIPSMIECHLMPALNKLSLTYPRAKPTLYEANSESIINYVKDGHADLGFAIATSYRQDELEYMTLMQEPLCIACAHDHPLTTAKIVTWKDLEKFPIAYNAKTSRNWLQVQIALRGLDIFPNWQFECLTLLGVLSIVACGDSIAIVPKSLGETKLMGSLEYLNVADAPITREVGLFKKQGASTPPMIEALIENLRCQCQNTPLSGISENG